MKRGNKNTLKSVLAKPRLTRTPEYVRRARYSLTNSYLIGQSTEICGRAGKCADKRPFHQWQRVALNNQLRRIISEFIIIIEQM